MACDNFTASVLINFSYSQMDTNPSQKAACIGVILRNDYLGNNTFVNSSIYPNMEVEICSWWSATLPRSGSIINLTLARTSYELCTQTATSADGNNNWPTFVFVGNANLLTVTKLDVMLFVGYIHQNLQSLTGYCVSGVYFGYRIYTGKGNFIYTSDPQLSILDLSAVPPMTSMGSFSCPFATYNSNQSKCSPS